MPDETLDQVFQRIFKLECASQFDPWFNSYCGTLIDPVKASRQYHYRKYLLNLAGVQPGADKAVLDAGCGFGPNCIFFYLYGFGKIIGLDIYEPMIQTMKQYLPGIGLEKTIVPMTGDVDKLSSYFPPNSFDLIFSNEAISHYHDVDAFIRESYKVLKPGGVIIVSDTNNGANPRIRKMNQRIWDVFENGPPGQVFTHTVKEPYIEKRKRIIHEAYPDLEEEKVVEIARGTFLMTRQQILDVVQRYLKDGVLPQSYYREGICPLEPEINIVIESMFVPRELAKRMEQYGFEAKALAYLGGATRGGIVFMLNRIWQALSFLTFRYSEAFIVIARKKA